jgi:hypothetical protein
MKFNRELFIDETAGDLGSALDVIDELVGMLNGYCQDDDEASGHELGVYGYAHVAEKQLLSTVEDKFSGEFLEPTFE